MAKLQDGPEYVMLMGYDTSKEDEKETFLFSNAGFVKQEDAEKFADWAKNQNFYGRWMPERRGMIEFLWNDYPWLMCISRQSNMKCGLVRMIVLAICSCRMKHNFKKTGKE